MEALAVLVGVIPWLAYIAKLLRDIRESLVNLELLLTERDRTDG